MQNDIYLAEPSVELENEYLSFYQEWVHSGETMIPWVISKDPSDFPQMVEFLLRSAQEDGVPEGLVPASTFWLVNHERRVLGAVNIRHRLTEHLFNAGGHIGYGIRPSQRRKGYATELLRLSLERAKDFGIKRALIVCNETNRGSEKVIRNNGGIPDQSYVDENGNVILRFWIDL